MLGDLEGVRYRVLGQRTLPWCSPCRESDCQACSGQISRTDELLCEHDCPEPYVHAPEEEDD